VGRALLADLAVCRVRHAPGDQVRHDLALVGDDHHQHVAGHDDQQPEAAPAADAACNLDDNIETPGQLLKLARLYIIV
jgi:hypothetical protein